MADGREGALATHLTATGPSLAELRAARSVDDCLAGVRAIADITPGHVIWGSGGTVHDAKGALR